MKSLPLLSLLLAACVSVGSITSAAQEPSKKEALAGQLMELLNMQKMMDRAFDAMPQMQKQMMASQKMTPEQQEKMNQQMQSSMQVAKKELGWDTIKPMFVKIYADNFDEAELKGLINFYKTPVGQTWIEKQPAIQAATMQAMSEIMPKIQAAMMRAMTDSGDKAKPVPVATP